MKKSDLFLKFINNEKSGGIILLIMTLFSLILANSPVQQDYSGFWETEVAGDSLVHWINDGLMAIFFLYIGLELEREIYTGELSNLRKASLPIFAATGGMLMPALVYTLFNYGTPSQPGAGIPMATDIAFAVGILSLLGNRVPPSLKIFLTALAVIDDLGSILVIAVFYSGNLNLLYLVASLAITGVLIIMNRLKIYSLIVYVAAGILLWYFLLHSGVHSTLAGVILAFVIPFSRTGKKSPSFILHHLLVKPVTFIILPLFALANTALTFEPGSLREVVQPHGTGIILGLIAGKPAGIFLFSYLAVKWKFSEKPAGLKWSQIFGIGFLGGIGFTMSIFISLLAFDNEQMINTAKVAILTGSFIAGLMGYFCLRFRLRSRSDPG